MKRYFITLSLIALTSLTCMVLAQNPSQYPSLTDISNNWKNKELSLPKNVSTPSVTQLVRAFNDAWRTEPGDMVALKSDNPNKYKKLNSGVDAVFVVEQSPSGNYLQSVGVGEAPWMEARTWIRSNGHRFFAVNISNCDGTESVMAFYDFNPDNGMLVPDEALAAKLVPQTAEGTLMMKLPEEGDEVVVNEHIPGWQNVLGSYYTWDGMNLVRGGSVFTGFTDIMSQYREEVGSVVADFTKFALIDIDGDGTPELWLRTEDDNEGAFFCMGGGKPKLITTETWKIKGNICEHGVLVAGSAGTGAFYANYVLLENSRVVDNIYYNAEYNIFTEDMDVSYSRGETPISIAEGEAATARLGKAREVEPVWYRLSVEG